MDEEHEYQPPSNKLVKPLAALVTVTMGVVGGVGALYCLKSEPPPPEVVFRPPAIRYVERPPEIRYVEKPVEPPPAPPPALFAAPPTTTVTPAVSNGDDWTGVWRPPGMLLPMFQVKKSGTSISGSYTPLGGKDVFVFRNGKVIGKKLEFTATDGTVQEHFRLEQLSSDDITVTKWMDPQDSPAMIANVRRRVMGRTLAERLYVEAYLAQELRRLGKTMSLGRFCRIPDPGEAP